jgi:hypothetical protein
MENREKQESVCAAFRNFHTSYALKISTIFREMKRCLFFASVIVLLCACSVLAIVISSGHHVIDYVINDGVHVNSDTRLDLVPGGKITLWLQTIGTGRAYIMGGTVGGEVLSSDDGFVSVESGILNSYCMAFNNGLINISGGTIMGDLIAHHNSIVSLTGGIILGDIFSGGHSKPDNAVINIYGHAFAIDGVPIGYGQYFASDFTCGRLTGTLEYGNMLDNDFYIYDNSSIVLLPEPIPVACIEGGDRTIEAQGAFGARITLDGSCSSDADSTEGTNDDINDFDWYRVDPCDQNEIYIGSGEIIECNLPIGENIIILEVTDKTGLTDSNEVTISVQDTTPPEFEMSVSPAVLWPPNGKMVKITPTYAVSDLCDEQPEVFIVEITMNEVGNVNDDIQITDGYIFLRAERIGKGTGRVYTITYKAVDNSGNETVQSATVTVPHNHR